MSATTSASLGHRGSRGRRRKTSLSRRTSGHIDGPLAFSSRLRPATAPSGSASSFPPTSHPPTSSTSNTPPLRAGPPLLHISSSTALPPELWARIAAHACMDGGRTGAALLRVSRGVAEGAGPHAFASVVLCGARAVHGFCARVRVAHAAHRRVRALFVCDVALARTMPAPGAPDAGEFAWEDALARVHAAVEAPPAHVDAPRDEPLVRALASLFTLLAPGLESLALVLYNPHLASLVSALAVLPPLSRLRTLTLRPPATPFEAAGPFPPTPTLPRLTHARLSLAGLTEPGALVFAGELASGARALRSIELHDAPLSGLARIGLRVFLASAPPPPAPPLPAWAAGLPLPPLPMPPRAWLPAHVREVLLVRRSLDSHLLRFGRRGVRVEEMRAAELEHELGAGLGNRSLRVVDCTASDEVAVWLREWLDEIAAS